MTPPRFLTLAAALLASGAAQAARPLVTDDAGVLEARSCELEAVAKRAEAGGQRARESAAALGCGIGLRSQVGLGLSSGRDGADRLRGRALVGKTSLWRHESGAGLSLGWAIDWSRDDGQRWRHAGTGLNLIYSRALPGDTTLHVNLGHGRDPQAATRTTTWGLALEHAGWWGVAPMVELHGDDREAAWWNLGLRWSVVPEAAFLDASYGRQISPEAPSKMSVGMKLAF